MVEKYRETGIGIIRKVPWGSHLSIFFGNLKDFHATLALFLNAGLKNNEACLLITANPNEVDITGIPEMAGLSPHLETGQMEILACNPLLLKDNIHNIPIFMDILAFKMKNTLGRGYEGLRIAGDFSWINKDDWKAAFKNLNNLRQMLEGAHILGLCGFSLDKLWASELVTIMSLIPNVFINQNGKTTQIENFRQKQAFQVLKQKEARHRAVIQQFKNRRDYMQTYLENTSILFRMMDSTGKVLNINNKTSEILGHTREEIIGKNWFDNFVPSDKKDVLLSMFKNFIAGDTAPVTYHKCAVLSKNGEDILIAWHNTRINDEQGNFAYCFSAGVDTTGHKLDRKNRQMLLLTEPGRLTPLHEKYINTGLQELGDLEILELFFGLNLPADIAHGLAQACIDKYHSLREFLAAPVPHLQRLGIPRSCIFGLKLLHELPVRVLKEEIVSKPFYTSPQDIFNYLRYSMQDLKVEVGKVIYLNVKNQIIDVIDLFSGSENRINLNARSVIESAIEKKASSLIFVHNHPSGDTTPSKVDIHLTRDLVFVSSILQIGMLDHIIIGDNHYYSFADQGLIKEYELDFLNLRLTGTSEAKKRLSKARLLKPGTELLPGQLNDS